MTEYQLWNLLIAGSNLIAIFGLVGVTIWYAKATKQISETAAGQAKAARNQLAIQAIIAQIQSLDSDLRRRLGRDAENRFRSERAQLKDELRRFVPSYPESD